MLNSSRVDQGMTVKLQPCMNAFKNVVHPLCFWETKIQPLLAWKNLCKEDDDDDGDLLSTDILCHVHCFL